MSFLWPSDKKCWEKVAATKKCWESRAVQAAQVYTAWVSVSCSQQLIMVGDTVS